VFSGVVNVLFWVGASVIGLLGVAIMILVSKFRSRICPNCGHHNGHKIASRRILGTERALSSSERFSTYAKYWNRYECQYCGHKWSVEGIRQI
jgi:ribosomal protein L44E